MAWLPIDDQMPDHPKIVRAGGDAAWLFICGLCYCKRYATEGVIPKPQVAKLSDRSRPNQLAARLVEVGLWHDKGDHYAVHDWSDWNRSSESRSAAGRRAAEARWQKHRNANADANASEPHSERIESADAPGCTKPQPKPIATSTVVTSPESRPPADDDDGILNHAARLVASDALERRTAEKGSVGNPDAWLAKAAASALEKHRTVWARMLQKNPATTPQQLAAAVAAPPKPPDPLEQTAAAQRAAAQRTARRLRGEACPACEDSGVILTDDNQAHPCDTCRRTA